MIASTDPFSRKKIAILDSEMAYIDEGQGDPIVFLHGNPTSSYLWRNIIPHLMELGRCLAPDLIGMGDSGKPDLEYRFKDHSKFLDEWFSRLNLDSNVTLVVHDWGSALAFDWAFRHPASVKAFVYMEAVVQTIRWENWPEKALEIFQAIRSSAGEELVLERNLFIERILPGSIIRKLSDDEMEIYRRPFQSPASRRPTLTWPREIPIEGEPPDVNKLVNEYSRWMAGNEIPKLFINAEPGAILTGEQREFCRTWKNQKEITVKGIHFIQEDSTDEIAEGIAEFLKSF